MSVFYFYTHTHTQGFKKDVPNKIKIFIMKYSIDNTSCICYKYKIMTVFDEKNPLNLLKNIIISFELFSKKTQYRAENSKTH